MRGCKDSTCAVCEALWDQLWFVILGYTKIKINLIDIYTIYTKLYTIFTTNYVQYYKYYILQIHNNETINNIYTMNNTND